MIHVFMSENDYKSYAVNTRRHLIEFSPLGDQAAGNLGTPAVSINN